MKLDVESISVRFGPTWALRDASFCVSSGEVVAILGPNGSGKSTVLRAVSGLVRPCKGDIRIGGKSLVGCPPETIVRDGIVHVPEGRRVFGDLTVRQNLLLGAYLYGASPKTESDLAQVYEWFPQLQRCASRCASVLSGGEQQQLAIGRGLMSRPQMLLLDSPTMGLPTTVAAGVFDLLAHLSDEHGIGVVIVSHSAEGLEHHLTRRYHLCGGGNVSDR